MSTAPRTSKSTPRKIEYPTSDGKPMAETDVHRELMFDLIRTLKVWFAQNPLAYVSGNLLMFYEEGNKRKHVSPDVFVVQGIKDKKLKENYLIWEEGRGPDLVIELTSKTTKREDMETKMRLYRDVIRVPEYVLFDPTLDYLRPALQGFRLIDGGYRPIELVDGRLPSAVLGLHFEREEKWLRIFNPATREWLPTPEEEVETAKTEAEVATRQAEVAKMEAEAAQTRAQTAEAENERLRREMEELRRHLAGNS